jgi:hypothetical protein
MLLLNLRGPLANRAVDAGWLGGAGAPPYPELPQAPAPSIDGEGAVFISGRFRSGSTMLWNVFRQAPDCTAYYEPLNERRWFSPQSRGGHTDPTHKQVSDYWREYDGLVELADLYEEDWIRRDLFMPTGFWAPKLRRYIEILIARAKGKAVLQFNRVDFRLPWLRSAFPRSRIVHLYRHPRDQWLSTLYKQPHFPLTARVADFQVLFVDVGPRSQSGVPVS